MKILDEIERYVVRLAVFALISLVLVQSLMTSDSIRFYLSMGEHLEGRKVDVPAVSVRDSSIYPEEAAAPGVGSITVETIDYTSLEQAFLLINGRRAGDFSEGKLTVAVVSGDVLEIDAAQYLHPVQFRIEKVSSSIKYPLQGQVVNTDRSTVMIGKTELE